MADSRKIIASVIAISALVVATLLVVALAVSAAPDAMVANVAGSDPHLRLHWRVATFFMKSGKALNGTYVGLLTILTVGTGYLADLYTKTWQIAVTTLLCIIGIAAATVAMMQVVQPASLGTLRWFAGFAEDAAAESSVYVFFGAFIGWFVVFLATELGISLGASGGALAKMVRPS